MTASSSGGRQRRPHFLPALAEFAVIAGFSLLMLLWVIPTQTMATGSELSLSPQLLPMVCAALILLIAAGRFLVALVKSIPDEQPADRVPVYHAIGLLIATLAGAVIADHVGWIIAGVVQVILVVLLLGERRPAVLALLPAGTALTLYLIGKTGI